MINATFTLGDAKPATRKYTNDEKADDGIARFARQHVGKTFTAELVDVEADTRITYTVTLATADGEVEMTIAGHGDAEPETPQPQGPLAIEAGPAAEAPTEEAPTEEAPAEEAPTDGAPFKLADIVRVITPSLAHEQWVAIVEELELVGKTWMVKIQFDDPNAVVAKLPAGHLEIAPLPEEEATEDDREWWTVVGMIIMATMEFVPCAVTPGQKESWDTKFTDDAKYFRFAHQVQAADADDAEAQCRDYVDYYKEQAKIGTPA